MTPRDIASSEIRLADLVDGLTPVAWHEAVALVHQVGRAVMEQPALGVPGLTGLHLGSDGVVRIEPTAPAATGVVAGLADLLKALLPPTAPEQLAALADSTSAEVRHAGLNEFLVALTFFSRPDEIGDLQLLAARAVSAHVESARAAALQALTERARQPQPVAATTITPVRKSLNTRFLRIAFGTGLAIAILAFGAWALTRDSSHSAQRVIGDPAAQSTTARRVQHELSSAAALVMQTFTGRLEQPKVGRGADLQLPAPKRRRTGTRELPATAVVPSPMASTSTGLALQAEGTDGSGVSPHGASPPVEDGPQAIVDEPPPGVFSAAHPDVVPPALVRAQMPQVPIGGLPIERPGVLEVVVDANGEVLGARLVPTSTRYQDRMMVSAAKTWRFTPATRNGEPVQYRLQMPITW